MQVTSLMTCKWLQLLNKKYLTNLHDFSVDWYTSIFSEHCKQRLSEVALSICQLKRVVVGHWLLAQQCWRLHQPRAADG